MGRHLLNGDAILFCYANRTPFHLVYSHCVSVEPTTPTNHRFPFCAIRRLLIAGRFYSGVYMAHLARHQLFTGLQSSGTQMHFPPRNIEGVFVYKLFGIRVLHAGHVPWAVVDLQALREIVGAEEI